jgi:hypothetical protein
VLLHIHQAAGADHLRLAQMVLVLHLVRVVRVLHPQ